MDVGTISIVLVLGLVFLLAIGMPLGFASAVLALVVMVMKFEPGLLLNPLTFGEGLLTGSPGTGPLYILTQKIFGCGSAAAWHRDRRREKRSRQSRVLARSPTASVAEWHSAEKPRTA